jgi:hypothetical protein
LNANLKTNKESSIIIEKISDTLIIAKRKIKQNQKKSRIEAAKTILLNYEKFNNN